MTAFSQNMTPPLTRIARRVGYRDLYLIDYEPAPSCYSALKRRDFNTSLLRGPYRDTAFARAFRQCRDAADPDAVCLTDFEEYEPSPDGPAAFLASPIHDGTSPVGILAFQLSIGEISRIVSGNNGWQEDGLGRSGETGIVGPDFLMRTNARGYAENPERHLAGLRARGVPEEKLQRIRAWGTTALQQEVRLPSVAAALEGRSGAGPQLRSSGASSFISYGPLDIPGLHWSIASRIDDVRGSGSGLCDAFAPHLSGRL